MAGLIPQDFIDDLLHRTDIVDVIGEHVQLRKAGKDYQGLCPFHNEKTPSFTVSQAKQFYHCFGCGANGSAIGFLMENNHLNFVEAIKDLAAKAGVQVPESAAQSEPRPNYDPIYQVLDKACKFYETQLRRHSTRQIAVNYLKQRGLSGEIAAAYHIGFAPAGWDNLLRNLALPDKSIPLLVSAGLIIKKETGGFYDRFRDRIIFPIRDYRGRVTGFGGRVLEQGEPKYLNSPETPVFHKGRELYGLFEARRRCKDLQRLIVVEGYMDVVALAQYGINNAVATLGTATTPDHLQRLFRVTSEIVFCFDGDNAGYRAAWKALETSLPYLKDGQSIRFLFMPEGEDPDSLIRKQGAAYFEMPANLIPLSDFLFNSLLQKTESDSPEGRARLVTLAKPLLSKIPQGAYKTLIQQRLSELSHIETDQLNRWLPDQENIPRKPTQRNALRPNRSRSRTLSEQAIHLLLTHPEFAHETDLPEKLEHLDQPHIRLLVELINLIKQHSNISTGQILEHWRDTPAFLTLSSLLIDIKDLPVSAMLTEYTGVMESLSKKLVKLKRSAAVQTADGKITDQIKDMYKRPRSE